MLKSLIPSSLAKAVGAAVFAIGLGAAPAMAAPAFTVDENPGAMGDPLITADAISFLFTAHTVVTGDPGSGTFTQSGQVRYTNFTLGGIDFPAAELNNDYALYGDFTASGTSSSTSGGIVQATGFYDTFNFTLYYDRTPTDDGLDLNPDGGVDVTRYTPDADTEVVFTGTLVVGTQTIQVQPNQIITFVLDLQIDLTDFGATYFIDPDPFYQLQLNSGIAVNATTDDGFDVFNGTVASGNFEVVSQGTGSTTFAQVPEPATLALLGVGLVGIGFGRRRGKANAA